MSGSGLPIDAVAVLGAQVHSPGVPGAALRRRLEHGIDVFRARGGGHLLLSGGGSSATPSEAAVMADMARAAGVPDAGIVVEDRSRNTFENAAYCGRIMRQRGWQRILIVTDGFHLRRALYVFRRLGLDVEGAGVPRPAGVSRLYWYGSYADEAVRLVRTRVLFALGAHKAVVGALDER